MSELRERLEWLGERVPSAPDAFERLERARRRRERNRRITAGALALLVAIAGSVAAFAAFSGSESQVAGSGDDGFVAIWPESTYEEALEVQQLVDAGDPSLIWRLDARETALRFAHEALGWADAEADPSTVDTGGARVVVRATGCPSGGALEQPGCPFPREASVHLSQLDGSNGIWNVVSARSPQFTEMPAAGTEVVAGNDLLLGEEFPPRSGAFYVGFVGLGPCVGWEYDVITPPGEIRLTVPSPPVDRPEGCPVALLVLRTDPADHSLQGAGQLLLDYGFRTALYHVLATPLQLVHAPGPATVPDVANVTCDGSSITADTSVVAAQPDGVHIDYSTVGDGQVVFTVEEDTAAAGSPTSVSSGRGATEPNAEVILQTGPGRYLLICDRSTQDGSTGPARVVASLDVVDLDGYFKSSELECAGGEAYGMAPAYVPGAKGDQGDPVDVVGARLTGLREGDSVERAGYPEGTEPIVRVVRDGAVVAKVHLFDDGQGGWLLSSLDACGSGGEFGWSSDATAGPGSPTGPNGDLCEPPSADLLIVVDEGEFVSDVGCVSAPAGEPLTITLDNRDSSGHNVWIYPQGSDDAVFRGAPCFGPDHITYSVQPLEAGRYGLVDAMNAGGAEMTLVVA